MAALLKAFRAFRGSAVVASLALAVACGHAARPATELNARASDEWTRSYQIDPDGEVQISARDGSIDIEAADGSTVEIRAERTVYSATEEAAAEVLPRVQIREEASPARVSVSTLPLGGIVIGVRVEVNYHVRAPRTAQVRLRSAEGAVRVNGFTGRVVANATNGGISAEGLAGGIEGRTVNGDLTVSLLDLGRNKIELRTTNGSIVLTIPADADATLEASAVNGEIDLEGVAFEPAGERSGRRVRGRINDGGVPIEVSAVNGSVRVAAREPAAQSGAP